MATKTIDVGTIARASLEEANQLRPMPGLDLRVFKQNQKLRLENERLLQENDRLGSKNVQLVFQVREWEDRCNKFLEQLQGARQELARLGELEKELAHRQAELARREGALEAARLHVQKLEVQLSEARAGHQQLAQERARAQRLEVELLAARREIESLQSLVLDLKEECLARLSSQEDLTPPAPPLLHGVSPFEGLCRALSAAMGLMGRSLVEQVFERLDLSREVRDSQSLRAPLDQLQMMAPHLATSPEQLQRAQEALARFETSLDSLAAADDSAPPVASAQLLSPQAEPSPAPTAAPTSGENPQEFASPAPPTPAQPAPAAAPPAAAVVPTSAAAADLAPAAPLAEKNSRESSDAPLVDQAPPAEPAPPTPPSPTVVELPPAALAALEAASAAPSPSAMPGAHLAQAPTPPLVSQPHATGAPPVHPETLKSDHVSAILASVAAPTVVTRPARVVLPETPKPCVPVPKVKKVEETPPDSLYLTKNAEIMADLEWLPRLAPEEALKKLQRLDRENPSVVQIRRALFDTYVAAQQWADAHEAGRGLEPWITDAEQKKDFLETFTRVLKERLQQLRSAAEKKKILLELAELHLEQPKQAVRFLRQAEILPDRIPGGGRIDFHLTCLLAGGLEDRSGYLINYMRGLNDKVELFEHVKDVYRQPQHSRHLSVAETVVALGRRPRNQAEEFERRAAQRLSPSIPDAGSLEKAGNPIEESVVRFTLDHLLPQAGLGVAQVCETLLARLKDSVPAPETSPVVRVAREANGAFGFGSLDLRRYQGQDNFLVDAGPGGAGGTGVTLIYHPDLEGLAANEVRFLVYRTLFQHHRRHLQLQSAAAHLDDPKRYRLVKTYLDLFKNAGAPIPAELVQEVEALPSLKAGFGARLEKVLDQAYKQTRSDAFLDLKEFLFANRPFSEHLDRLADQFASQASGLTAACYALARETLGRGNALMLRLEREGFQLLYLGDEAAGFADLRQRLQWLWAQRLEG